MQTTDARGKPLVSFTFRREGVDIAEAVNATLSHMDNMAIAHDDLTIEVRRQGELMTIEVWRLL